MARKIGLIVLCLGTVCFASMIGFQLYSSGFNISSVDARAFVAFLTGVIAIGRMLVSQPQHTINTSVVEKEYTDILENVFSKEPKARKKLLQAIVLYNQNKFRSAINRLITLLKTCDTNKDASAVHFFLALCYDDQELWTQALEHYLQVVRHNPANDTALSNAGLIYKKMGNINDAIDCYRKAIAVSSDNAFSYNNLAIIYLDIMEVDNAIKAAENALGIKRNMYQAMNTLAMAYSLKNDKQSAEKYFQQSVINGCPDADVLRTMMNHMTVKSQEMQDENDS